MTSVQRTTGARRERRRRLPSLRRELVLGLTVLLMAALAVGTAAIYAFVRFVPEAPPGVVLAYLAIVMALDVLLFAAYGHYKLSKLVLRPVDAMVAGAEAVAAGDLERRLDEDAGSEELARLARSVNAMAERLIQNQRVLAENVRSLEETNRLLTEVRDELVRAEKLASVGRLAAGIAHEVGNPLGALLGTLDLAKRRRQLDAELHANLRRHATRIDRIVRGLLDYARPRPAVARPTAVNDVVRQVADLLATQGRFKEVELRLELDDAAPQVEADPSQLEQVLVNLLLNALDAIQEGGGREGGRIEVRTEGTRYQADRATPRWDDGVPRRRDDPPGVDYSHIRRFHRMPWTTPDVLFRNGDPVTRIVVRDDGPGIPEELVERIFEPFFTTKDPGRGTGLGLAVSARLVEAMGGTIQAANDPRGGAVFTIWLPAVGSHEASGKDDDV